MRSFRPVQTLLPFLLSSGALVMLLLTTLAGVRDSNPLNRIFFLSASTGVSGSPSGYSHWTLWNLCGATSGGHNFGCGSNVAAYGFNPRSQLPAIPIGYSQPGDQFITSRVFFAFMLIALSFVFLTMLASLVGFLGRLGAFIGSLVSLMALASTTVAAVLMTVVYVRGQNAFRRSGVDAHVGVKAFALVWTSMFLMLLTFLIFTAGCAIKDKKKHEYREKDIVDDPAMSRSITPVYVAPRTAPVTPVYVAPRTAPIEPVRAAVPAPVQRTYNPTVVETIRTDELIHAPPLDTAALEHAPVVMPASGRRY